MMLKKPTALNFVQLFLYVGMMITYIVSLTMKKKPALSCVFGLPMATTVTIEQLLIIHVSN